MLYNIVRMIFAGAVVCALLPILRKTKLLTKWYKTGSKRKIPIVLIAAFLFVWQVMSFFPVENMFLEFRTVGEAFRYNRIGRITMVVEGEQSALVMYKTSTSDAQTVYPKTASGGYILDLYPQFSTSVVYIGECGIVVYKVDDCDDFYVRIVPTGGVTELNVVDNCNSEFRTNLGESNVSYTAYVENLEFGGYVLTIDDIDYSLGAVLFN